MLTKQQQEKYLTEKGVRCPFCNSGNIGGRNGYDFPEDGTMRQTIGCDDCNQEWTDIYKLIGIEGDKVTPIIINGYTVEMSSEEYGAEEFHYDTPQEAYMSYLRLKRKAKELKELKDGIERKIRIYINTEED